MQPRIPDFAVIGAQKSASTYLSLCLAHHADVYMAPGEIPFFEDPDYSSEGWGSFIANFEDTRSSRLVGFKRANYLAKHEVAPRLAEYMPRARFIVSLRNPIDRAVSAYFHYMRSGFIPLKPLEEGLAEIVDGRGVSGFPAARDIVDYGMYATHLERLYQYIPPAQVMVTLLDDLANDEEATLGKVGSFIGVDNLRGMTRRGRRAQATVTSFPRLRFLRAMRPLHSRQNREKTRTHLRKGPLASATRNAVLAADRYVLERLLPGERPDPSPELRAKLAEAYSEDLAKLEALLGRDLTSWRAVEV